MLCIVAAKWRTAPVEDKRSSKNFIRGFVVLRGPGLISRPIAYYLSTGALYRGMIADLKTEPKKFCVSIQIGKGYNNVRRNGRT